MVDVDSIIFSGGKLNVFAIECFLLFSLIVESRMYSD